MRVPPGRPKRPPVLPPPNEVMRGGTGYPACSSGYSKNSLTLLQTTQSARGRNALLLFDPPSGVRVLVRDAWNEYGAAIGAFSGSSDHANGGPLVVFWVLCACSPGHTEQCGLMLRTPQAASVPKLDAIAALVLRPAKRAVRAVD